MSGDRQVDSRVICYSDGWCEQGGRYPNFASPSSGTFKLLKEYKDTNYMVFNSFGVDRSTDFTSNVTTFAYTTKKVKWYSPSSVSQNHYWMTAGYIS